MGISTTARPSDGTIASRRSRALVWAACLTVAAVVPLFGFYFGLAGSVVSLTVVVRAGYTARQRIFAAVCLVLGASLAALWLLFSHLAVT